MSRMGRPRVEGAGPGPTACDVRGMSLHSVRSRRDRRRRARKSYRLPYCAHAMRPGGVHGSSQSRRGQIRISPSSAKTGH